MTRETFERKIIHPIEVAELYGPAFERTTFLSDFSPARPGVNRNQLEVVEKILPLIKESDERDEGMVISIFGTMFAGKTTVVCLLADELKNRVKVYKHKLDFSRTGEDLINHSHTTFAQAEFYEGIEEMKEIEEDLIIDELQLDTIDNDNEIVCFLEERKRRRQRTIVSQLDFNYRRDPWRTAEILTANSDWIFVLQARCEDCGNPAEFTQRNINGQPADISDSEVVVGSEELYEPKCWRCHQVGGREKSFLQATI